MKLWIGWQWQTACVDVADVVMCREQRTVDERVLRRLMDFETEGEKKKLRGVSIGRNHVKEE